MKKTKLLLVFAFFVVVGLSAQNLIDYSAWTVGNGSAPGFTKNGPIQKNVREMGIGPHNTNVLLWKAIPDATTSADGGWNTDFFNIDNSYTYRLSVWIKKTNSNDGRTFFGPISRSTSYGQAILNLNGTTNTNPYFFWSDLPQLNQWYLLVAYVHHSAYTSQVHSGRIYDTNGVEVATLNDYKFKNDATKMYHRSYLFYDTNNLDRQYFYAPTVYKMDGTEPSVQDLLNGLNNDKITITSNANSNAWTSSLQANIKSGDTLFWEATNLWIGVKTKKTNTVPTFDFSENNGSEITLSVSSSDNLLGLSRIWITHANLTSIDVSKATDLTNLNIKENYSLTSLDVTTLTSLTKLYLNYTGITSIDVSQNNFLKVIHANNAKLSSNTLDQLVIDLDENGVSNGTLKITSNTGNLTSAAAMAYNHLIAKGWNINVPAPEIPTKSVLSNFRIDNAHPDRVLFNASKNSSGLTSSGFTISSNTISSLTINNNGLGGYFTVATPFTFWDNNTIRLENGDGTIHDFTLQHITNNISEPIGSSTVYYVSLNGSDTNNGTSENTAFRTIQKAVDVVTPGSTVWIKAGNYGNEKVLLKTSGTLANPIKFIGYKNVLGDITSNYYAYGDGALNPMEMPLLEGVPNTGNAFTFSNKSFLIVKNIQFTKFKVGFYGNHSSNIHAENIITIDFERGIQLVGGFDSYNNRLKNCISINARGQNFNINGQNTLLENCKSYSDNSSDPTDYYFSLKGKNNIIKNSYAKRIGNLNHYGHAMSVSGDTLNATTHNLIEKLTSVNITKAAQARRIGCSYNVFREIVSYGEGAGESRTGGIMIRDNASYNIFENCTIDTNYYGSGINFTESTEVGDGFGHHNSIRNSVFKNNIYGIYLSSSNGAASGNDNEIINCTFDNNTTLFRVKDTNYTFSNCKIINSSISNTPNFKIGYSLTGWAFDYNNFYNGFAVMGTNAINVNPQFVDAANGDFHLQASSLLIDAGTAIPSVNYDFDNIERIGNKYDIGAFEYAGIRTNNKSNTSTEEKPIVTDSFILYPNPSQGIFNINVENKGEALEIWIVNLRGSIVYKDRIKSNSGKTTKTLNLSHLEKGIYLFRAFNKEKNYTKKMIIN